MNAANGLERADADVAAHLTFWLVLIALGSALIYGGTYLPVQPGRAAPPLEVRLVMYPMLFALYFVAAAMVWRRREGLSTKRITLIVVVSAIAFRGLVLSGPVPDNNDNRRYLWEGRVLLAGMNPYAAPPASPAYDDLRRELREAGDNLYDGLMPQLNTVRSVYGPVATGLFAIPHWLPFDRVWTLRLMMTLFDVGAVLVIMGLLRSLGRAPALALVYAWNPMCMSSFPDRGQMDALMVFFLALAVWLLCLERPGWAGLVFGVALLVKVSPLYLALPMIRTGRLRFLLPLAVAGALGLVPFGLAGEASLSGFREFGSRWHNMDSVHGLALLALQPLGGLIDAHAMARALVLVAAPAYAIWRTAQGAVADREWLARSCAAIAATGILLSPVVYPWYTAHLLVFLCFVPSPGLLLLTCATMAWFLGFWRPPDGTLPAALLGAVQHYYEPWRWVAYPPVFALLVRAWLQRPGETPTPRESSPSSGSS